MFGKNYQELGDFAKEVSAQTGKLGKIEKDAGKEIFD